MMATEKDQLLLIEHDDKCANGLLSLSGECGWWVTRVSTADDAYKRLESGGIRAVVLDRWLPDSDGLDILSFIRDKWPSLPAIVITTNADTDDRVDVLEAGADAYIATPHNECELRARLKSLFRRASHHPKSILVRDLQLWKETRIALHSGRLIKLSPIEFDLLHCLATSYPEPVNRITLLKNVFKLQFEPGTNIVEVHIHRLRRKLDDGRTDPLLQTIRGKGYALA